jgi:hypothetical protein
VVIIVFLFTIVLMIDLKRVIKMSEKPVTKTLSKNTIAESQTP